MSDSNVSTSAELDAKISAARDAMDAHTVETVQWHFNPETGCPFWLKYAAEELKFDPRTEIKSFEDLKKFPPFEDEWLRGGHRRRPRMVETSPVSRARARWPSR